MLERARQLQRAQHLLQVAAIALEGGAITLRALGAEELGGDGQMTVASGTRRGSAESTPSTSVQMSISVAPSNAPKMEAEKSLPFRPSVVGTPRRSTAMKPVMTSVP